MVRPIRSRPGGVLVLVFRCTRKWLFDDRVYPFLVISVYSITAGNAAAYLPCTYIVRPPSLARRGLPATGLVGCAQQYQQVRTDVTYQAGNAVPDVVLGVACVGSTFCSPLTILYVRVHLTHTAETTTGRQRYIRSSSSRWPNSSSSSTQQQRRRGRGGASYERASLLSSV